MRRLLLLLVLVSANVRAQEALPLDAEVPPEVSGLPLRSGGTLSWGVADGAPAGGRYRTSLGAGPWLLGVAGESRPGERAAPDLVHAYDETSGCARQIVLVSEIRRQTRTSCAGRFARREPCRFR